MDPHNGNGSLMANIVRWQPLVGSPLLAPLLELRLSK